MCTLKSPMSQLLSNKSVKVFSHQTGRGGGDSAPKKFLLGGAGGWGGYGLPAPPYFVAFEVVEQLKVTQCG